MSHSNGPEPQKVAWALCMNLGLLGIYMCEYTKFPENIERRVPRPSPYLQNLKIMYGWGITHQTNFKKVLPELSEEKPGN